MGKLNLSRRNFILKGMFGVAFAPINISAMNSEEKETMSSAQYKLPKFNDGRSKKVIFIAHCILNQNARINKAACSPASIIPVVTELLKREIGIIQMPCPETEILGLSRGAGREIYDELSDNGSRKQMEVYAQQVIKQIDEYRKCNFRVLGVLGIDGSPSCGVKRFYYGGEKRGTGAFMEIMIPLMASLDPPVPVMGIKDAELEEAIRVIDKLDEI